MSAPTRPRSALVPRKRNKSMAKHDLSSHHFQRNISDFCEVRIAPIASKRMPQSIRTFLIGLVIHRQLPPIANGRMDWTAIGQSCGIENQLTADWKKALRPGLDAIIRWPGEPPAGEDIQSTKTRTKSRNTVQRKAKTAACSRPRQILSEKPPAQLPPVPRGPPPKPISPFPKPLFEATDDPASFQDALFYHVRRFGESYWQLYRVVIRLGETFDDKLRDPIPHRAALSTGARLFQGELAAPIPLPLRP